MQIGFLCPVAEIGLCWQLSIFHLKEHCNVHNFKKGLPVLVDAPPDTTLNECSIVFPTDPVTKEIMSQADARIWITAKDGEQSLKKVPFRVTGDTE